MIKDKVLIENETGLHARPATEISKEAMKYNNYAEFVRIKKLVENKDTLGNDLLLSNKPFYFRGKLLYIQREIPPNPVVRRIL